MSKADLNPSGIIKTPSYFEIFNSPSYRKMRAKALAHDPLKGKTHVAKAPPSPHRSEKATQRLAQKAEFFVGQVPTRKASTSQAKPAKTEVRVAAKPKKAPTRTTTNPTPDYFDSTYFKKMKRKALTYDPLKHARRVPKVPSPRPSQHALALRESRLAQPKAKRTAPKPQPSLTAAYVSRPGQLPQFEPVRVVKNQAQLGVLLRKGDLDLLSAIAYCDRLGQIHTGSVLEIYSMLPS